MQQAVVFDFGGVIFDWNPRYVYDTLIADAAQREWFLREVCNNDWNVQQDAGRSLAAATQDRLEKFPRHADWIHAYYGRWHEMLRGELPQGVALLRRLHAAGVPLYGLTNWSAETFPYAEQRYPFLQLFRDIVVSGREQLIKPDPRIYALLEQRSGHAPAQLIFIDDNAVNIAAAQARGWTGILHRDDSMEQTIRQLQASGLHF